jgi:hypothetical protein
MSTIQLLALCVVVFALLDLIAYDVLIARMRLHEKTRTPSKSDRVRW